MNKKNLLLTTALCMCIAPAFADNEPDVDIAANASDVSCDSGVLQTSSGSSTLEADWSANHVRIKWYDGNDEIELSQADSAAAECVYDGTLTLPTAPTKNGYTFSGWKVKASAAPANPQQTTITLSSLYDSGTINIFASKSLNPGVYCEGSSGWDDDEEDNIWYGVDQGGSCSDSEFSGLNNGEWTVEMPNGNKVKGIAACSTTAGNNHSWQWGGNSADWSLSSDALQAGQYSTDNSSGLRYCWCKPTSADTGSGYQSVAGSRWVFDNGRGNASNCARYCAFNCADDVRGGGAFRRAVFGVSE